MRHIVYLCRDTDRQLSYIGIKSFEYVEEWETYRTSSTDPDISENLEMIVLKECKSREEALSIEIGLHDLLDVDINPLFFNRAKQTSCGFSRTGNISKEHKLKISNSKKVERKWISVMGEVKICCSQDLAKELGVSEALICRLVKGKAKEAKGWTLYGNDLDYCFSRYANWEHDSGVIERGKTAKQIQVKYGLKNHQNLYNVKNGKIKQYKGWRLATVEL